MIDAVRIDANISDEMRGDRWSRAMLPDTNSIADRATALKRAARLQLFQIRLPGAVTNTSDVVMHEQDVFGHTNLPDLVQARPEVSAFYGLLR